MNIKNKAYIDLPEDQKEKARMMSLSHEKLQKELDKCVLLCANCHRIKHHGDSY